MSLIVNVPTRAIETRKVRRYYAPCGDGFWTRKAAEAHRDRGCCWKDPALKTCKTCKFANWYTDDNGDVGSGFQSWREFECKADIDYEDASQWHPPVVHEKPLENMNIHCPLWEGVGR